MADDDGGWGCAAGYGHCIQEMFGLFEDLVYLMSDIRIQH